jgi:two-component system, sensor histidine kinase and response regulator
VEALLAELKCLPDPGVALALANSRGDFFVHPNPAAWFARELGGKPEPDEPAALAWKDEIALVPNAAVPRLISLQLSLTEGALSAGLADVRNQVVGATVLTTLLAALAIAWLVRRAVTQLESARQRAEVAAQAREDFIAHMSHEIRTPMNSVMGMLGVLERNNPPAHQGPVLKSLKAAAGGLLRLLNDALDWSKLKAGMVDIQSKPFSLPDLLDELVLTHRPQAMQRGLQLTCSLPEACPQHIQGDVLRLGQILHNLLANALKFTHTGKVELRVLFTEPDAWQFVVEDTGVGIAPADLLHIFDPYQQVGPRQRAQQGTGLGLAIAQQLAGALRGELTVRSELGVGSTFCVALPMAALAPPSVSHDLAIGPVGLQLGGQRLLYIEDVASNHEVMEVLLADTGAELHAAYDAAAGRSFLQNTPVSLVLLDLQLPDADGRELAAELLNEYPELPIVAVTAQTDPAVVQACLKIGMSGVVAKPIDRGELWEVLRESLGLEESVAVRPDLSGLASPAQGHASHGV